MLLRFCLTGQELAQAGQGADATTPPHAQAACGHHRRAIAVGARHRAGVRLRPGRALPERPRAQGRLRPGGRAPGSRGEPLSRGSPTPNRKARRAPTTRAGAGGAPTWLGRAWNALLALAMLFMLLAVTESTFGDILALEGYPTWFRAISYFGLVYLNLCSLACLALDKRRLARRLPFLGPRAAHARHRAMLVVLGVTVLTFLLGSMVAMAQMGMLTE